uniref:Uncharacterized protein n=1 Tax=Varanus komodoensis TaxID=61221 RepID=A0A8D2LHR8_VARKO
PGGSRAGASWRGSHSTSCKTRAVAFLRRFLLVTPAHSPLLAADFLGDLERPQPGRPPGWSPSLPACVWGSVPGEAAPVPAEAGSRGRFVR